MAESNQMKPLAAHVAEFVTQTRYADLPGNTVRMAKKHILDTIGVGLAGVPSDGSEIIRRYIESLGCSGAGEHLRHAPAVDPALCRAGNASAMHADDYDDTYHPTRFHSSAPVISAVCAEAEGSGASGRDVLAAFAVGTEVSVKLSHTIDKQHICAAFT